MRSSVKIKSKISLKENSISLIGRIPIHPSIAFGDSDETLSNDIFDEIAKK
ncbi:MAG: hypothetical protein CM1200mP17_11690 [Woeseia sp.]|nr:MAG: hypothetical protein CM1200mP17_11690 [Woeseia sp.]